MNIEQLLCRRYFKMSESHLSAVQCAFNRILADCRAQEIMEQLRYDFFIAHSPETAAEHMRQLAEHMTDLDHGLVYAAVFCAFLPSLVEVLQQQCQDEQMLADTLLDYSIWAEEYEADTGKIGVGEYAWLCILFSQKIFRIGRLQYECCCYHQPYSIYEEKASGHLRILMADGTAADGNICGTEIDPVTALPFPEKCCWKQDELRPLLLPGLPVLNVHIPRGGALTPDAIDASLKKAAAFFKARRFPQEVAICESWLLDPAIPEFAAQSANICAFQRRFAKYPLPHLCSDAQYRIFGTKQAHVPVAELAASTRLQQGYKAFCMRGGQPRNTGGVLLLPPA